MQNPAKILVALTLLCAAACNPKAGGATGAPPAPEVGIVTIKAEPVSLSGNLTGRTSAFLVSEVRPQVSGVVKARLFTEGAYVKAGQALYQIEPAIYKATVAQAQANASAAEAKAARYKDLVAINAISRQENDDAQAAAASARAVLDQAQIDLGYTRVFAPISGRIGKSSVTPGALVTANQADPLTTVQDTRNIYVDVTQSAADYVSMKRDLAAGTLKQPDTTEVTLTLEDGTVYPTPGKLAFSDITVDEGTGSVNLRAVFPNPDGVILPGMYVRAKVTKGVVSEGILVPQAAVTRDAKGDALVFIANTENKAEPRTLTLGQSIDDKWLVTGGLKPGDRVIVEGLQKIRPGAPVTAVVLKAEK